MLDRWAKLGMALAACSLACRPPAGSAAPGPSVHVPLSLEPVTISLFSGEALALRLRAEHLQVVPRTVGPFRVGALRQVVLSRTRCEVLQPAPAAPGARGSAAPAGLLRSAVLLPGEASRGVVGASIFELDCVVIRGGARVARFVARRGELGGRGTGLALNGFRLERLADGAALGAENAEWLPEEDAFVVRGAFVLRDGDRVTRGRGIRVDPELRAVPAGRAAREPAAAAR